MKIRIDKVITPNGPNCIKVFVSSISLPFRNKSQSDKRELSRNSQIQPVTKDSNKPLLVLEGLRGFRFSLYRRREIRQQEWAELSVP